jgi:2-dehydropantoate 2-reductase
MKIAIIGAGSLGSAIGALLQEAGNEVWLITRNAAHVKAIQERGLVVQTRDASGGLQARTVSIQASTSSAELARAAGHMDLVIVLVKSAQTHDAVQAALPLVGEHAAVLSLQNGLGHEDIISSLVGKERTLAGKTYVGGQIVEPGVILSGSIGKDTHIGELSGEITPRIKGIAKAFEAAGLQTVVSDNILGTIWDKLFINVATGALSGITGLAYGHLYQVKELEETAVAAVSEAMQIAKAKGIRTSIAQPIDAWRKAGAGLPFDFKASVLQTLERGVRTEVDFINGAVVAEGEKLGIPTPVNRTLLACIKGREFLLPV